MIFIDTGAFVGRFLKKDQYNEEATLRWTRLSNLREVCFNSNFILDETVTLLARRAGYQFAAERARQLYSSLELQILRPSIPEELAALELFEKFADQKISFTDCVSFVLMRQFQIKKAFSFDAHFERAGFELWS